MIFKKCSGCGHNWNTRDEFISDHEIQLIGYQVNFEELDTGYFMFNHMDPKCLTTISIHTGFFKDLYRGEVYHTRQTGSLKCPGFCQHTDNLKVCPVRCECNFVREVMQVVQKWPKIEAA